jgi:quinate dehydrogenase
VVGGGGTCRTAIYTLQRLGCGKVYIINRDAGEVESVLQGYGRGKGDTIYVSSIEEARQLEPPGLVVSAIPDYTPTTPAERLVRDILRTMLKRGKGTDGALLEMCYHPSPDTQITQLAEQCGWKVIGGLEAMIAQGLEQAKLWTGIEVDETLRREAREAIMRKP